jgi:hypothetical protein
MDKEARTEVWLSTTKHSGWRRRAKARGGPVPQQLQSVAIERPRFSKIVIAIIGTKARCARGAAARSPCVASRPLPPTRGPQAQQPYLLPDQ